MRIHLVPLLVVVAAGGAARAQPGAAPAAPAATAAPPDDRAHLLHVPPGAARTGEALRLVAVIDGLAIEPTLVVRHRAIGSGARFAAVPFERSSAGGWYATIPGDQVAAPGVEYFIAGQRADGSEVLHFASDVDPHPVVVEASVDERRAAADRARLGGRVDVVSFDVDGHDFGNRYGNRDDVLRVELAWTHHVLGGLYALKMGFGRISGRTPDSELPTARSTLVEANLGFGELRLRAHPSIYVDLRASIGVDDTGFVRGVGGAMILGKPWRSNLSFGGEAIENLGPTAWMRLQWDTAPPFLMGASVVKTDLPAAVLDDGLYVKYDISYVLQRRLTLRAALSYGSRDGAASLGGGLGVAAGF